MRGPHMKHRPQKADEGPLQRRSEVSNAESGACIVAQACSRTLTWAFVCWSLNQTQPRYNGEARSLIDLTSFSISFAILLPFLILSSP